MPYVTIEWGKSGTPSLYEFDTEQELQAFMDGVDEATEHANYFVTDYSVDDSPKFCGCGGPRYAVVKGVNLCKECVLDSVTVSLVENGELEMDRPVGFQNTNNTGETKGD